MSGSGSSGPSRRFGSFPKIRGPRIDQTNSRALITRTPTNRTFMETAFEVPTHPACRTGSAVCKCVVPRGSGRCKLGHSAFGSHYGILQLLEHPSKMLPRCTLLATGQLSKSRPPSVPIKVFLQDPWIWQAVASSSAQALPPRMLDRLAICLGTASWSRSQKIGR